MDQREQRSVSPLAEAKKDNKEVTVEVNTKPVSLEEHRISGIDIKQAAVAQGVPHVSVDFLLMLISKNDGVRAIGDDEVTTVTKHSKFKMVAADDNSEY